MANTNPPIDNRETLEYVIAKGRGTGLHLYSSANVTAGMNGSELTDMETLSECGAVAFTDDGRPINDESLLRKALLTQPRRSGSL